MARAGLEAANIPQMVAELEDGTVAVSHLVQEDLEIQKNETNSSSFFSVKGDFCKRRPNGMTVFKQLLLRIWVLFIGRFNANLTRSIVQKIAITGKPKLPYKFERKIEILSDRIKVIDYFPTSMPIKRISVGSDATSIYVANSLVFQESRLNPWQHADLKSLPKENDRYVWEREYYRGSGHDAKINNKSKI